MAFNSAEFALFFAVVFLLYWALPQAARRIFLLVVSVYFYSSCGIKFVLLLFALTAFAFGAGLLLEKTKNEITAKTLLILSICLLLSPLFIYKYFDFFSNGLSGLSRLFGIALQPTTLALVLPLGISFYTFQNLGYVIDVYRGRLQAERNFIVYCLFSVFFPQISSGPIGRGGELIPQLKAPAAFDYGKASAGLKLIVWGGFKKMVIADNLAVYVNRIYGSLHQHSGFPLMIAALFFSIEIYCDFSGYTDLARGCAKMLGIELRENFKSPYFSSGVKEFWSRWHISLSTWFKDYLYIPLGGNRVGKARHVFNLMVTFLVSGLWHGANRTFLIWGALHGLAQVLEKYLGKNSGAAKSKIVKVLKVVFVFAFVTFAWIFFRADSAEDAIHVISNMFVGIASPLTYIKTGWMSVRENLNVSMKLLSLCLVLLAAYDYASLRTDVMRWLSQRKAPVRYAIYIFVGTLVLLFHYHGEITFIYSQF